MTTQALTFHDLTFQDLTTQALIFKISPTPSLMDDSREFYSSLIRLHILNHATHYTTPPIAPRHPRTNFWARDY
ncbi:MAG: hypothetical protein MH252_05380 [Thermosynechococcaceae cyanobacterium MS004]|nr:hypothetical protein [Thermosynechococcaceae cyanobacterium MS004]